jgi:hypothetical protein
VVNISKEKVGGGLGTLFLHPPGNTRDTYMIHARHTHTIHARHTRGGK